MDLIVQVPRLPKPGETVAGDSLLRAPGGKGANQAVAAARMGAAVTMVGRVGRDSFGRELKRSLRDEGVATRSIRVSTDRSTGAALIAVDERGENSIAVATGANLEVLPDDLPRRAIQTADVVSAALEVPLGSIAEAFRVARLGGDRTVEQSAFAVPSIDSTGAGDAFVAGFVCGRWWSDGLEAALRLGCAAGALATTKAGAQPAM